MVEYKKEHCVKRLLKLGIGSTSILCVVSPLLLTHDVVQATDINNRMPALNTLRATSSYDQTAHMDELRSAITSDSDTTQTPSFNEITVSSTDETDAASTENVNPSDEVPAKDESESTAPSTEQDTSIEEPGTEDVPSHEDNHHNTPSQEEQPSPPDQPGTNKDEESGEKPNKENHQKPNQPNKDKPSKDENKKPDKGNKPAPPSKTPNRPDQKEEGSNNTPPLAQITVETVMTVQQRGQMVEVAVKQVHHRMSNRQMAMQAIPIKTVQFQAPTIRISMVHRLMINTQVY
ncbi:hypothetical protein K9E75_12535 [Staphylococcus pseudintermedius]|nr:hypothetical protein K9E75_12535 [Staphylococcus pseudintermedius]